jgi:hypothetical protein
MLIHGKINSDKLMDVQFLGCANIIGRKTNVTKFTIRVTSSWYYSNLFRKRVNKSLAQEG